MELKLTVTQDEADQILMGLTQFKGNLEALQTKIVLEARQQLLAAQKEAEEATQKEVEEKNKDKKEKGE